MAKTTPSPIADLKVRQAIDLAINREELQQDLEGGHGTRSLFPQGTPWYQDNLGSSLADTAAAGAKLDAAGWTLDGTTNKRTKDGVDLTIDLFTYAFRPDLCAMQPEIAANLEALGITPTPFEKVCTNWLHSYRSGGHFLSVNVGEA